MHADILPAAKPIGCPWVKRTLTLLAAAAALLATRSAVAQRSGGGASAAVTNVLDISQQKGNETDPSIAINPLNSNYMAVVASSDGTNGGLFFAMTTNQGGIWTSNFIATNNDSQGLSPAGGPFAQASVAFDAYGNLFLAYQPATFLGVAIAVSTNGGSNFATVTTLAPLDVTDQPRITAPPIGAGAGSVWAVYKDYTSIDTPLQVQGMVSTGLGAIGTFGVVQPVPGSDGGGFADIAVGPYGQVMVAFQDNLAGSQPNAPAYPTANIFVSVETNAIADGALTYNGFSPANLIASDAIGGITYIDAAPTGIGVNAAPGLAWNNDVNNTNFGNVNLIYTAVGPMGNAVISFMSSSDYGTNAGDSDLIWSGESYVDDDAVSGFNGTFNDHFLPRIAVDQLSGYIVSSWFDCRNDQGSKSQPITNVITMIFTNTVSMITNVDLSGLDPGLITNYYYTTEGTNITVIIVANSVTNTMMTSDGSINIYLDDSNFDIMLDGTNVGSTVITVILTNIILTGVTSGKTANAEAIMYATLSTNSGASFEANQPLISLTAKISPPAVGIASDVGRSSSLTGWGHYTAMAAFGANFFSTWPDNSDIVTNNPDKTTNFDIYFELINFGKSKSSVPYADLTIFVTNSPNPVISQEEITYSIIVSNRGNSTAMPVTITNLLSPYVTLVNGSFLLAQNGTEMSYPVTNSLTMLVQTQIVISFPSMSNGVVLTNTFRVSATVSSIATNYATIYSPLLDLAPTYTSNLYIVPIDGESLALGMTASETNVLIGDTVITTVTVTNLGPATNGPVFITNYFSPNWTNVTVMTNSTFWTNVAYFANFTNEVRGTNQVTNSATGQIAIVNLGLVPSNGAVTATFSAVALSGDIFGDTTYATNYAYVGSQDVDTNSIDRGTNITYYINGEDLAIGMTTSSPTLDQLVPFTYTIYVTNFGLSYSGLVTVTNTISTNIEITNVVQSQGSDTVTLNQGGYNQIVFSLGILGAGEVATMTVTAIPLGLPVPVTNIATVSSTDFNTDLADTVVTNAVTINGEELAIGMTPSSDSVDLGQPITFTIKVVNLGASYTGVVTVTNEISTNFGQLSVTQTQGTETIILNTNGFDQIVFNLGTLGADQYAVLTVTAIALSGPTSATNFATVSSTDFDLNPAITVATNLVIINDEDLGIGLKAAPTNVQVGQTVTFSESVTNFGLSTNGVVMVTNVFSTNFGTITVLQPATGYTEAANVVTFNLGTLNAGQVVPITMTAIATAAGIGSNAASVGSLSFDSNLPNNTASASVTITYPAISNLVVTPLVSSAFFVFDTSTVATAQVKYGLTSSYGNITSVGAAAATHHVILITGLTGGTNYDFQVLAYVGTTTLTTNGSFSTTNVLILSTPNALLTGPWNEGTVATGIYGGYYQYSATTNLSTATTWAVYDPPIPAAGLYNVSIWYPADASFSTNAQVYVAGNTNELIHSVNQTVNGGFWLPLATNLYIGRGTNGLLSSLVVSSSPSGSNNYAAHGTNGTVIIYNNTGETNRYVVANAMMWVYDAAQDYPTTEAVPAWWANFYYGTNVNGYVNGANMAANGYSIFDDYVLGLNPTNAASTLSFTMAPASASKVAVTFSPYQGGRSYELEVSTNLAESVWTPLTNTFTLSTNGAGTFTVTTTNSAAAFYRLSAYVIP
jgi:uncharacterized repeat protein (TIGR01451 family)